MLRSRHTAPAVPALLLCGLGPTLGSAQDPASADAAETRAPQVEIVQTVGCVERRAGDQWWLVRAAEPGVVSAGVFDETEVAAARGQALGTGTFRLVGEADFLGAEGLLRSADRAAFTTPDQVNATGQLRAGRTVLVKGLRIDADAESRINLLAVVGLGAPCA